MGLPEPMVDSGIRAETCAAIAAEAGLDDFGPPDFHAGLDALVRALRTDQSLAGDALLETAVAATRTGLTSRLRSEAAWQTYSTRAAVEAPIFIVGMPRTGTTALHQMLARDDRFQGLESWLLRSPRPRPPRESWPTFPAYRERAADAAATRDALGAIHWVAPEEYDECQLLMAQTLVSNTFGSQRCVPSYDEWYLAQDYVPSFQRLRRHLELIGSGERGDRRWLLKNPSHLFTLDALLDVFPDATVIVTHRDPVVAVASVASLLWTIRMSRSGDHPAGEPQRIGARECRMWSVAAARMVDLDERLPGRLVHVFQRDLATRPHEVLAQIYAAAGMDPPPVGAPSAPKPREATEARHVYDMADFGLDADLVREAFAGYRTRFGFH